MNNMMRELVDAHNKASKLERAIRKERIDLIKEFKERESSDSDWYIAKLKYVGLSSELKKECDKFSALLEGLEQTDTNSSDEYEDIVENVNDLSSSSESAEVNSLYNESIPVNEEQIMQRSGILIK